MSSAAEARPASRTQVILPLASALAAMVCFQVGAAVAKGLFPAIGPEGAATLRLALGALMLVALSRPWRTWPARPRYGVLIGFGIAIGATILCFYMAVDRVPLGVAISLQFLGPLAVAVGASRRFTDLMWAALAAVGVWCLVGMGARFGGRLDPLGVAFALGAAVGWGVYIVVGRAAMAAFGQSTAAVSVGIGALVVAPFGIAHAGAALFAPALLPMALLVAVLTAAAPFSLELYALSRLPPRTFATFTSLEPAIGVGAGLVLLQQQLSLAQFAGVGMVIAAAAGAAWSSARRTPDPLPPD
jgi:inner membrane transporter RhtA